MTGYEAGTPRVAAIVVNWNGADQLGACVEHLLAQDYPNIELVVVDNASTDSSREVVGPHVDAGRVRLIANHSNRGYAGGANDGLAATSSPIVAVCNFDVRPNADYVTHAVAALLADDRRGSIQGKLLRPADVIDTTGPRVIDTTGPRVIDTTGPRVIDTTGHVAFATRLFRNRGEEEQDDGQYDAPGEIFGVSGALAVYRREMLEDVAVDGEIFDEDLFAFWEDVDLDWRAQMRGWTAWFEPAAVAEHERGGAGPRRTADVERLNYVNRLLTLIKCDSPASLLRASPGFALTTTLKSLELVFTVPLAFVRAIGSVRLIPTMLGKRHRVHARATVPSKVVVARWFGPFDYEKWIRTWWGRLAVRGRRRR